MDGINFNALAIVLKQRFCTGQRGERKHFFYLNVKDFSLTR